MDEAAAFDCGFGRCWSSSGAVSSLWVRTELCLSTVRMEKGEEEFYCVSGPSVIGGVFYVFKTKAEMGDQDLFGK